MWAHRWINPDMDVEKGLSGLLCAFAETLQVGRTTAELAWVTFDHLRSDRSSAAGSPAENASHRARRWRLRAAAACDSWTRCMTRASAMALGEDLIHKYLWKLIGQCGTQAGRRRVRTFLPRVGRSRRDGNRKLVSA